MGQTPPAVTRPTRDGRGFPVLPRAVFPTSAAILALQEIAPDTIRPGAHPNRTALSSGAHVRGWRLESRLDAGIGLSVGLIS